MINNEYANKAHTSTYTCTPPTHNISHPTARTINGTNITSIIFEIRETIQSDMGASTCITNKKHLLSEFETISAYYIRCVEKDSIATLCTGKGYIPWYSGEGYIMLTK